MTQRAPYPDDSVYKDHYRALGQSSDYEYESGLVCIPLASAKPGEYITVRLHAPMGLRKVAWTAVKEGTPPLCPKAEDLRDADGNVTDELLASKMSVPLPVPLPTGVGYEWRCSGSMTFVQKTPTPHDGSQPVATGQHPYQTIVAAAVPHPPGGGGDFAGVYGWSTTTLGTQFFGDNLVLPSNTVVDAYQKSP